MQMPNPINPNRLTAKERLAELCRLLAVGLIRMRQRESSELSDGTGEIRLHSAADQSVHATPTQRRTA